MAAYAAYHQLKYSSPNRSKKLTRATQKSIPFGKWRFRENMSGDGPKAENDPTERATGLGRTKKEI